MKDTKIEDAATLTLQREDHSVGNVLRMCATSDIKPELSAPLIWCTGLDSVVPMCRTLITQSEYGISFVR